MEKMPSLPSSFQFNSKFMRWGDNNKFWAIGSEFVFKGESHKTLNYGDWSEGTYETWTSFDKENMNDEQKEKLEMTIKSLKEATEKQLKEKHEECRKKFKPIWDKASETPLHEYLKSKGLTSNAPARVSGNFLLIEVADENGFNGYQRIFKSGSTFEKRFSDGLKKHGSFCAIPSKSDIKKADYCYLVEGFATGKSVYEATNILTIVAFDAGNISPAIETLRKINPSIKVVIAADYDHESQVGQTRAKQAANKFNDVYVKIPDVLNASMDWNDIHQIDGIEEVKKQLDTSALFEIKAPFLEIKNPIITKEKEVKKIYEKGFKKLPKMEGFGQIIFKELYDNSPIKRTQMSFMCTLNLVSILIGNKLFHRGTPCNLFLYGLAPSGFGKDAPFKRSKQILIESGFSHLIGSSSPTSETVVLKLLERSREQVMFINEAESLLKRINNDKTNQSLRECLTELFDEGKSTRTAKYLMNSTGKTKEAEAVGQIFSPFVNMIMTSTIEAFDKYGTMESFLTGFLSRFLFFFEDRFKRQDIMENYKPPIPDHIKQAVVLFAGENSPAQVAKSHEKIPLIEAKIDPQAQRLYHSIHNSIEDEKSQMFNSKFFSLFSRKLYYVNKFVLIHHAMINPSDYTLKPIREESYIWAKEAVDAIVHNMLMSLDENVSESSYDKKTQEFCKYIRGRTEKGLGTTLMDIGKRFLKYPKDERRKTLEDLMELQVITRNESREFFYVAKSK